MNLPKFLIADNSEFPENVFVVHTEKPRFIVDIDSEEIKWLGPEPDADDIVEELIDKAFAFYESELDSYEDADEDE